MLPYGGEELDSKKRLAIVIAITCLIVAAIFASFGRSLFFVQIPSISGADGSGEASGSSGVHGGDQYWQIAVTPETVQSVVATLSRPESYYRELTVETLWSGGSYASPVQYWEDGGWSHTRQTLSSGAVRHDLTGPDTAYYWYEGSADYASFPADERSGDLAQHIPTYETVLELDPESITGAGYELRGSLPCVYVEVQKEGGALAGSTLRLNHALRNVAEVTQKPLSEVVAASSLTAAESVGLAGIGRLEPGYFADIVLLDTDFEVVHTFVGGELRYSR